MDDNAEPPKLIATRMVDKRVAAEESFVEFVVGEEPVTVYLLWCEDKRAQGGIPAWVHNLKNSHVTSSKIRLDWSWKQKFEIWRAGPFEPGVGGGEVPRPLPGERVVLGGAGYAGKGDDNTVITRLLLQRA